MSAAEDERDRRLRHGGYHLGDRQPRLDVTSHRIKDHEKAFYILGLLDRHKKRDHVLVFRRLLIVAEEIVTLDLTYYIETVDRLARIFRSHAALEQRVKVVFATVPISALFLIFHLKNLSRYSVEA